MNRIVIGVLIISSLATSACSAQEPARNGMGGIAVGLAAAPVYDDQKRLITAGGFVDSGPVVFQDITKAAGLAG